VGKLNKNVTVKTTNYLNRIFIMESQSFSQMLIPSYKKCSKCNQPIYSKKIILNEILFYCDKCHVYTKWCHNTILYKKQVSEDDLSNILTLFLDKNTLSEANSILQYNFVNKKLNPKAIEHYYSIFNRIIMEIYIQDLDAYCSIMKLRLMNLTYLKQNLRLQHIDLYLLVLFGFLEFAKEIQRDSLYFQSLVAMKRIYSKLYSNL